MAFSWYEECDGGEEVWQGYDVGHPRPSRLTAFAPQDEGGEASPKSISSYLKPVEGRGPTLRHSGRYCENPASDLIRWDHGKILQLQWTLIEMDCIYSNGAAVASNGVSGSFSLIIPAISSKFAWKNSLRLLTLFTLFSSVAKLSLPNGRWVNYAGRKKGGDRFFGNDCKEPFWQILHVTQRSALGNSNSEICAV